MADGKEPLLSVSVSNEAQEPPPPLQPPAGEQPQPRVGTPWASLLLFTWAAPLLKRGAEQAQLHQRDLFQLPPQLEPGACGTRLWGGWRTQQRRAAARGGAPSLLRAIIGAYGLPYLWVGLLKLAGDALNFAGPLLLNRLLLHLSASGSSPGSGAAPASSSGGGGGGAIRVAPGASWRPDPGAPAFGYAVAGLLALSLVAKAVVGGQYSFRQGLISAQLRAAVTTAVYCKALLISSATLGVIGTGKSEGGRVQTLMSVDADRVANLCLSFHELWSLPAQIALALWLLYCQACFVQFAFVAGVGLVVLLIPINRLLAGAIQRASVRMMAAKDRRVRVMVELLRGAPTNLLFSLTTFGLYALMGRPLTPGVVFTSLALFNVLLGPLNSFPWVINGVVEAAVSVKRLGLFLQADETHAIWADAGDDASTCDGGGGCSDGARGGSRKPCSSPVGDGGDGGEPPPPGVALLLEDASFSWSGATPGGVASSSSSPGSQSRDKAPPAPAPPVPALQDVSVAVPCGALVAVTGEVGSGKSSLLCGALGEMLRLAGRAVLTRGLQVAYVPQEPWVMHASIRDNILLFNPADEQRYQAVLSACALHADLAALPGGDRAPCGGGGAQLSGGQRARVALARALYARADLLLLDDCLSAVDAHVATWLVTQALLGPLLWRQPAEAAGEWPDAAVAAAGPQPTVWVVTHSPALLAAADVVVRMEGGRVAEVEHRPDLPLRQAARVAAAAEAGAGLSATEPIAEERAGSGSTELSATVGPEGQQQRGGAAAPQEEGQHEQAEERAVGHVRWRIYREYLAATGWGGVALILSSLLLMQATKNGNDLWLSYWVSHAPPEPAAPGAATAASASLPAGAGSSGAQAFAASAAWAAALAGAGMAGWQRGAAARSATSAAALDNSSNVASSLDPDGRFYLTVLLYIAAANSVFTLARAFSFAKGGLVAARRLHARLLAAVLAAPQGFFDATPAGRILNRFSSDTATVDDSLPFIANILLANMFRWLQRYYRATSRELRRLDSIARSPIYSLFGEALAGGASIRAFGAQRQFMASAEAAVAAQQRAGLAALAASCWLGLRLQLLAATVAAAVAVAAVAQCAGAVPGGGRGMSAGLAGLGLSYVLPITGLLNGLLTSSAETEQEMVAAERVLQYLHLPAEGQVRQEEGSAAQEQERERRHQRWREDPATTEAGEAGPHTPLLGGATTAAPKACWLQRGSMEFSGVWLRYRRGGPFALRGLTLSVPAGVRLGVCGRTGAGKSSVLACLLRLAEPCAGRVAIDGMDVSRLPLCTLRSAIGVVPQQPFLFEGSLRENLDPYGRRSDAELESAVRAVHLWAPLAALAAGGPPALEGSTGGTAAGSGGSSGEESRSVLGCRLAGGGGLSQGQQQLLALARVLLRRPALLLLDECTASVDPGTAALMHTLVRQQFAGATVIEVAHRLAAIAACDAVAVMEGGRVVEQGPPEELAQQPGSAYAALLATQQQGGRQAEDAGSAGEGSRQAGSTDSAEPG
eukprot:scaffold30.g4434.t1